MEEDHELAYLRLHNTQNTIKFYIFNNSERLHPIERTKPDKNLRFLGGQLLCKFLCTIPVRGESKISRRKY